MANQTQGLDSSMRKRGKLNPWLREASRQLGFDLCGIAPASLPELDRARYLSWLERGFQGEMKYMEREQRRDLRLLLPSVRSVICAGMVYNTPHPKSVECPDPARGWISRYGWGEDYHLVLRERLEKLLEGLRQAAGVPFDAKICVDTAPLLERAAAQAAGVGWIGKNTCLIREKAGSWFLLGEILTSLEIEPDGPAPDRCGTCRRCIDACPTAAIVEPYVLDATRCISYFTIELRGSIPEAFRPAVGRHIFGCDICQDVCPWNSKAPVTLLPEFQPRPIQAVDEQRQSGEESAVPSTPVPNTLVPSTFNPPLEWLASLSEEEFRRTFRRSPVQRARYRGMLRNAAVAMGNSRLEKFRPLLEKLAEHPDALVQEHARWALEQFQENPPQPPLQPKIAGTPAS